MEKHQVAKLRAERHMKIADHMLTQTYPLLKDPKLLLAVVENIFMAMRYSMEALLYFDRFYKRIPPFQENYESKFNMFRARLQQRYGILPEHVTTMQNVRELIMNHKNSPVEFTRGDRFVICSDSFGMKTIDVEQIRKFIGSAKNFCNQVNHKVT
jgi:hypothetical protein